MTDARALEALSDGEAALYAILMDRSGVDGAEFLWVNENAEVPDRDGKLHKTGCYRLHPYQWTWFRNQDRMQVDQAGRSVGKSERLMMQTCAFPFSYPGEEEVLVTPEKTHADAITDRIEVRFEATRLYREMLVGVTHRPFKAIFHNGARIYVKLPQRDGRGVKGCLAADTQILTYTGWKPIQDVQVGERVWSHKNRWTKVLDTEQFVAGTVQYSGDGLPPLEVTHNHRLYGREIGGIPQWRSAETLLSYETRHTFRALGPGPNAFHNIDTPPLPPLPRYRKNTWWHQFGAAMAGAEVSRPVQAWINQWCPDNYPTWILALSAEDRHEIVNGTLNVETAPRHSATTIMAIAADLNRDITATSDGDRWRLRERTTSPYWTGEDNTQALCARPIQRAKPGKRQVVYNIVTEDQSFLGDNTFHHNSHPAVLHVDECVSKGTLVFTREHGMVPIEDIKVGDSVLTHKRRYRPVTAVHKRIRPTVELKGHGHHGLTVSTNHPFWATKQVDPAEMDDRIQIGEDGRGRSITAHQRRKTFDEPSWIAAEDMGDAWWSTPTSTQYFPVPSLLNVGEKRGNAQIPCEVDTDDFMWCAGLWVADGSATKHKATWSVHKNQLDETMARLKAAGLKPWYSPIANTDQAFNVMVASSLLCRWLKAQFGAGAHNKTIPAWLVGGKEIHRRQFFEGLIFGDGYFISERGDWKLTTVSRKLAYSTRMLATTLGYNASVYWCDTSERDIVIQGKHTRSDGFFQVVGRDFSLSKRSFTYRNNLYSPLTTVKPTGRVGELYDLTVEEDESFTIDGLVCHNSQDVSERAYLEMPEVVDWTIEGAMWQLHGVSKGVVGDFFHRATTAPDTDWTVHRITAMHRPDWSDERREEAIRMYGSQDSPAYLRNVYGEHGPSQNRVFVLERLFATADTNEASEFNTEEYCVRDIAADEVAARAGGKDIELSSPEQMAVIEQMLDLPIAHTKKYERFWAGMDVGLVADPSEIVVAAEYLPSGNEKTHDKRAGIAVPDRGQTRLRIVARIRLRELPSPLQAQLIMRVIEHYKPQAFSMDSTGNGLPVFELLQQLAGSSRFVTVEEGMAGDIRERASDAITVIKGYNFSQKLPVAIDEKKAEQFNDMAFHEMIKQAGIFKHAKVAATDVLREWVDTRRLNLPYDIEILNQMNAQTQAPSREPVDAYGNRRQVYSTGVFHILDAMRMLALGYSQATIEELIFDSEHATAAPVRVLFGL